MQMMNLPPAQPTPLVTGLRKLLRHFPYTEMLALFLPVYAHLYVKGYIASVSALLLMIPFIFAYAAGFVYNNITDTKDDPYLKTNPLVRGEVSQAHAWSVFYITLAFSVLSFLLLYKSNIAQVVYFVYLFLCLAYSGCGVRFKETLLAPLIASFIVWVGGPVILLIEYKSLDKVTAALVLGSWLVFIGREVLHSITDYDTDIHSGYRTFAVRVGLHISSWIQNVSFVGGTLVLIGSVSAYAGGWPISGQGVLLSIILGLAMAVQFAASFSNQLIDPHASYFLIRVFYVTYAAVILQLAPLITLMFVWVFCTSKRS